MDRRQKPKQKSSFEDKHPGRRGGVGRIQRRQKIPLARTLHAPALSRLGPGCSLQTGCLGQVGEWPWEWTELGGREDFPAPSGAAHLAAWLCPILEALKFVPQQMAGTFGLQHRQICLCHL